MLDVAMPELNGLEVLQQLRRRPQTRAVPVILLTATMTEVDAAGGGASKADAVLRKPYRGSVLLERVEQLLDGPRPES